MAATHVTVFNHMHGLLLHCSQPHPLHQKISTGTSMTNQWQILQNKACIHPTSPCLKSSKTTTWRANWQCVGLILHLSQDRRNKIQKGQMRIWCWPEQSLSHVVYTAFPVSTCLKSRWHLLDIVSCAQTAHTVHSKWASSLEMSKPQFFLCFPPELSV